jgi:hypothetical protein
MGLGGCGRRIKGGEEEDLRMIILNYIPWDLDIVL